MSFLQHQAAEKKATFLVPLNQISGPSYFERALVALERNLSTPLYQRNSLNIYRKVASSRPVNYSILELFGQRSQYISIKIPPHKQSENP